jgi:hypothetical protein
MANISKQKQPQLSVLPGTSEVVIDKELIREDALNVTVWVQKLSKYFEELSREKKGKRISVTMQCLLCKRSNKEGKKVSGQITDKCSHAFERHLKV